MDPIAAIYDAVEDAAAFDALPTVLAATGGGRSAIVEWMGPDWSLGEASYNYFTRDSAEHYIREELYRQGPWRNAALRRENLGRIVSFEEEVPATHFVNLAYFHESLRRWGDDTARAVGGVLALPDGFVKVCVHRGFRSRPFEDEDAGRLQPVLPHLGRMFQLRRRLAASGAYARITEGLLEALSEAVFVIDVHGRLQLMNRYAEALVAQGDGLRLTSAGLRATKEAENTRLQTAIARACARIGSQGGALALSRLTGPPLRVLVAPVPAGHLTRALLLVTDPARPASGRVANLQSMFDLSRAEAEIAAALAEGQAPKAIARDRGVSINTVRTQIAQILRKLDARGISDLVRLVASSPI